MDQIKIGIYVSFPETIIFRIEQVPDYKLV